MQVLILGGTNFIGPHVIDALEARGHTPVLFNRGQTAPDQFGYEQLRGDRGGDVSALEGRRFAGVIDLSAYRPAWVSRVLDALGGFGHYVFVSTISVYAGFDRAAIDETTALAEPIADGEVTGESYGGLKVACEAVVRERVDSWSVVRPGLVVGPGDHTDRFTYWPARVDRGGRMLAPGTPADPVQFIDARDLAALLVILMETRMAGTYNAVVPPGFATIGGVIDAARRLADARVEVVWADADALAAADVAPWSDMPAWSPPRGQTKGLAQVSAARVLATGWRPRPLDATVYATLRWWRGLSEARRTGLRAGLSSEREAAVLADATPETAAAD